MSNTVIFTILVAWLAIVCHDRSIFPYKICYNLAHPWRNALVYVTTKHVINSSRMSSVLLKCMPNAIDIKCELDHVEHYSRMCSSLEEYYTTLNLAANSSRMSRFLQEFFAYRLPNVLACCSNLYLLASLLITEEYRVFLAVSSHIPPRMSKFSQKINVAISICSLDMDQSKIRSNSWYLGCENRLWKLLQTKGPIPPKMSKSSYSSLTFL